MTRSISTIAIIGGGFAGVVTALRLVRETAAPIKLVIVGGDLELGRGIAYSTTNRNHLVNGLAKGFGIVPEEPLHLVHWLQANAAQHGWATPEGTPFEDSCPPRWLYGTYVQQTLTDALAENKGRVAFEHLHGRATAIRRRGAHYQVKTDKGPITADAVVLATGLHSRAGLQVEGPTEAAQAKVLSRLWDQTAWKPVVQDQRLLVLGSSLTALDSIISAEDAGFRGEYSLLSRRGILVQTREEVAAWPDVLDPQALPSTLAALVARAREARRQIRSQGGHRQQLTMGIRPHVPALWQSASVPEKLRFIRYLRPYWENILHRAAPESGKRLDQVVAQGRLDNKVGRLVKLALHASGQVQVTWRPRGSSEPLSFLVDRVVDAHGYEFDWQQSRDPLVRDLLANGLVRPHATGFGIEADGLTGQVEVDGQPLANLFAVGHPLRGASWESNSIGEQLAQAVATAQTLARQLHTQSIKAHEPA